MNGNDHHDKGCLTRADGIIAAASGLVGLAVLGTLVWLVKPAYMSFGDCVPYVLQTRIFSEGHATRPAPPEELASFFPTIHMIQREGREFSRQPPGASAMFALLMPIVRDVRIAPPVVSALSLALTFLWVRRIYDRRTAVVAVCLCVASPLYLMIAPSVLSYPPSGLLLSATMLLFTFALHGRSTLAALSCGLLVGMQFTVRPLTAMLVVVALASIRLVLFKNHPKMKSQAVAFAAGLAPGIVLLLTYNRVVVGEWWPLAFSLYDPKDVLGFGMRGLWETAVLHTPARALYNLVSTTHEVSQSFCSPKYICLVPMTVWLAGVAIARLRSRRVDLTS